MTWFANSKIISTIGLSFDIVGAFLVAIEVVKVFREPVTIDTDTLKKKEDPSIKEIHRYGSTAPQEINPAFLQHEKGKRKYMWTGLVLLLLGFDLQILALWM